MDAQADAQANRLADDHVLTMDSKPEAALLARRTTFDVVVIGAGLAGCSAARLFALKGLRVALVDHRAELGAFKQLCTHYIQASAVPTLQRLGLAPLIEEAGGVRNSLDVWTRYGWTGDIPPLAEDGTPLYGYNIRRQTLDPILRKLTAETPGVTLFLGSGIRALVKDKHGFSGVEVSGVRDGVLSAPLIVAADGRNSPVAALANVGASSSANSRFAAIRAYADVPLRRGTTSQMWLRGPDVGYIFPNDGGVTIVDYMSTKDRLDPFRADANRALEANIASFPDAPDLTHARPLGHAMLVKDYPNIWRRPVVDNLALTGDALMSIDPLWGVGCGIAFQTAEWLVDSVTSALLAEEPVGPALQRYRKRVSHELAGHRFLILDFARRRGLNVIERLSFAAAAKDIAASRHLHAFGARLIGPGQFLAPSALLRAAWIGLRVPAAASAQRDAPV